MPEPEAQDIGSGDVQTILQGFKLDSVGIVDEGPEMGIEGTVDPLPTDELPTPKQDSPEIQALKADLAAQAEWEEQLKNFITRWIGVVKDHKPEVGAVMEDEYAGLLGG